MKKIQVTAPHGRRCPKEGRPREYIEGDGTFVEVIDSPYYRRLLKDGSLSSPAAAPAKESGPQAVNPAPADKKQKPSTKRRK